MDKIRVNTVAPAVISTPLIEAAMRVRKILLQKEEFDKYIVRTPMGRPGKPEEISGLSMLLRVQRWSYHISQKCYRLFKHDEPSPAKSRHRLDQGHSHECPYLEYGLSLLRCGIRAGAFHLSRLDKPKQSTIAGIFRNGIYRKVSGTARNQYRIDCYVLKTAE
ncbi:hypothetical protein RND71_036032 [Anisodus tanguticus]|uniref:Uncharacterized protein n=1 Tax=Anisodus tanguticus TaxID=243964 RepID=A0AAE1R5Z4_9SOLA|nr:hypothetical protein RND71_036032 [Anisodus tanguticus]